MANNYGSILPAIFLNSKFRKRELCILIVITLSPNKNKLLNNNNNNNYKHQTKNREKLKFSMKQNCKRNRNKNKKEKDHSVQRGSRHASQSQKRESTAFRSVELEFMESSL